jgi:hypothetical protein
MGMIASSRILSGLLAFWATCALCSGLGCSAGQGGSDSVAAVGKKRIADWSDNGTLSVSVVFGGESSVTLTGYAPSAPTATASVGSVGAMQYDGTQKRFTVSVMPSGSTATIAFHL